MLGCRFFVCERCDAVHADVEEPPVCARCSAEEFAEITASVQGDAYFTRATAVDR